MPIQVQEDTDLGANHRMTSDVTLQDNGHIDATTRTRTGSWLGGFTGAVQLLFSDANDVVIGASNEHTFGVDGSIIGRRDRTDYWGEDIGPNLVGRVTGFQILHYWAPRYSAINVVLDRAREVADGVGQVIQALRGSGLIR